MEISQRIPHIDGLRGILALTVFSHHFIYFFVSSFITGGNTPAELNSGTWNIFKVFALTPLNLLFNPGMAIYFFFVLSGFVLSYGCFKSEDINIIRHNVFKRYIRLAIPVLVSCLLLFFFHKAGFIYRNPIPTTNINSNWLAGLMPDNLSFIQVLKYGIFNVFGGDSKYNQVLWTMYFELIGSLIVFLFLFMTYKISLIKGLSILLLALPLTFVVGHTIFAAFIIGMIVCLLHCKSIRFNIKMQSLVFKIPILFIGLYLASFPYAYLPSTLNNSIYKWIYFPEVKESQNIAYAIGVSLLLIVFLNSRKLFLLFNVRPFQFLGKISFILYLIHLPLLFVFSSRIYEWLHKYLYDYAIVPITYVLSILCVFGISWILYLVVDRTAIKWSTKLAHFCLR